MRAFVFLLLAVGLASCDVNNPAVPDLGDPYRVSMEPEPLLDGDVLRLTVSYAGGCEDHEFELAYSVSGDAPELWLRHDANGDTCEALITRSLDVRVPADALQGRPVQLYISDTESIPLKESLQN